MKHVAATTTLLMCLFAVGHSAINWYDGKAYWDAEAFDREYGEGNFDRCMYNGKFVDFDACLIRNCKRYGHGIKMEYANDWIPDMKWGKWCSVEYNGPEPRPNRSFKTLYEGDYSQKKKCFKQKSGICHYRVDYT